MYICEVFVTNATLNVNQLYSYYSDFYIEKYKRVNILFAHSKNKGLIIKCYEIDSLENKEKELGFKISKILDVIDDEPIINDKQYELAKWLSKTTISPFISCLNTMLPKALRTTKNYKSPKTIQYIFKLNNKDYIFTSKQKSVFNELKDGMELKEAKKYSTSIINKFIKEKVIEIYEKEKEYIENNNIDKTRFKTLTEKQKNVYNNILNTDKTVSLLFGITGSGKTEVYLHLARNYIENGKEVLILVPEISLTPQMIQRVKERFNDVVFYHSELNVQERYEQYKRIKNKEAKIVVGTRSSIFLPFENIGLIIIDEEHDQSYKQDNTPCYNVRNVAIKIAKDNNAKVLLASATPSLDSYTRAIKNEFNYVVLDERINNKLPNIKIVDLVKEIKTNHGYIISSELKKAIENNLRNNKQTIILLNRRGYSPIIKCAECGTTLMCSACDIPLNYHKDENVLKCHQCGRHYKMINKCPKCNGKLIHYGFGTKKVQEELSSIFSSAKIERMDKDNVTKKGSHKKILDSFERQEIDILIGTQMIAKGLDYPNVTLVGILNADAGLAHQDYNSTKLTFDLLMQASGRSGRADTNGDVIIQAFNPDHYVLKAVLAQDYKYFYNIEMNYRNKLMYPPYSHILEIILEDKTRERLKESINFINNKIEKLNCKKYPPIELAKINMMYRTRILLMNKDGNILINTIWDILDEYLKNNKFSKIKVEMDPLYLE